MFVRVVVVVFVVAWMVLAWTSTAAAAVEMQWVAVGDAGNLGDAQSQGTFGSVAYPFQIGKYEVTNAQYVEFLNAKDPTGANARQLYSSSMSTYLPSGGIDFTAAATNGAKYTVKPGRANHPVAFVAFVDCLRFANWMNNGQGDGDTETGAYNLTGGGTVPTNAITVTRAPGASIVIPTENEWYKAAYYKGGGADAGYWDYATQSDALPANDAPPGLAAPANAANFRSDHYAVTGSATLDPARAHLSDVGAYAASLSAYGTYDQSGNVLEWNEAIIANQERGIRGGSWDTLSNSLPASSRFFDSVSNQFSMVGLRLAQVPEPTAVAPLFAIGIARLIRRRKTAGR